MASETQAKLSLALASRGRQTSRPVGAFPWAGQHMPPNLRVPTLLFHLLYLLKEAGSIVGKSHLRPSPAGPFPDVTSDKPGRPQWFLLQNGVIDASSLEDFFEAHSWSVEDVAS